MFEFLANPFIILINSFIFGFFTKLADLLNEHGLKMFKGANILFGILWGIFGTLVIIFNPLLASFYLAILINWILRGNIDYFNHILATGIIVASVLSLDILKSLDIYLFTATMIMFTGIGLLKDYKLIKRNILTNNNLFIFLALIIMIYFKSDYWIVLISYLLNSIAYQSVKSWGKKNIKNY